MRALAFLSFTIRKRYALPLIAAASLFPCAPKQIKEKSSNQNRPDRVYFSSIQRRFNLTSPICPNCGSEHLRTKNIAKKAGGAVGAVAGGASGIAGAMSGARMGFLVGAMAGPVGAFAGSLAGAALGGLFGAAVGCEVGATVGGMVDDHLLDNYACITCGHSFGSKQTMEPGAMGQAVLNVAHASNPESPKSNATKR